MNLLDLGILILLGLVTVRGYYRGLFQELAVLVGVVGGVVAAAHAYLYVAAILSRWISDPQYARITAFAAIMVGVYWLTRLVAHFLQRLLYHLYLDFFERLLGAGFALAKGALLIGFALMFLMMLHIFKDSRQFKESRTAPKLISLSRQSLELLPPDFKNRALETLQKWQQRDRRKARQTTGERTEGSLLELGRQLENGLCNWVESGK